MGAFKDFEREVIRILVGRYMTDDQVAAILDRAELASYNYTGVGYFLTVRHPTIRTERIVCDEPLLTGKVDDVECGFVVFLDNGELMLECHHWAGDHVPEDYRDRQVEISEAAYQGACSRRRGCCSLEPALGGGVAEGESSGDTILN